MSASLQLSDVQYVLAYAFCVIGMVVRIATATFLQKCKLPVSTHIHLRVTSRDFLVECGGGCNPPACLDDAERRISASDSALKHLGIVAVVIIMMAFYQQRACQFDVTMP